MLDLMAGDLVAAGYAMGVEGEQDTHAVPGAGSHFGGQGAGSPATATARHGAGRRGGALAGRLPGLGCCGESLPGLSAHDGLA